MITEEKRSDAKQMLFASLEANQLFTFKHIWTHYNQKAELISTNGTWSQLPDCLCCPWHLYLPQFVSTHCIKKTRTKSFIVYIITYKVNSTLFLTVRAASCTQKMYSFCFWQSLVLIGNMDIPCIILHMFTFTGTSWPLCGLCSTLPFGLYHRNLCCWRQ